MNRENRALRMSAFHMAYRPGMDLETQIEEAKKIYDYFLPVEDGTSDPADPNAPSAVATSASSQKNVGAPVGMSGVASVIPIGDPAGTPKTTAASQSTAKAPPPGFLFRHPTKLAAGTANDQGSPAKAPGDLGKDLGSA